MNTRSPSTSLAAIVAALQSIYDDADHALGTDAEPQERLSVARQDLTTIRETARRAIEDASAALKSDRKRRHVVTVNDLPVAVNAPAVLDYLSNLFARPFRAKGRGYGGTVDGKPQSGHWLRVTCRPSELTRAIERAVTATQAAD